MSINKISNNKAKKEREQKQKKKKRFIYSVAVIHVSSIKDNRRQGPNLKWLLGG